MKFTSTLPAPSSGAWIGIELRSRPQPNTRLEHVEVLCAGIGRSNGCIKPNADSVNLLRLDDVRCSSSGNLDLCLSNGRVDALNSNLRSF